MISVNDLPIACQRGRRRAAILRVCRRPGALLGERGRAFRGGLSPALPTNRLAEAVAGLFQMTFAVIAPALIADAFPGRAGFGFLLLFVSGWLLIVYVPLAHRVWRGDGSRERARSTLPAASLVHATAGISALVAAQIIAVVAISVLVRVAAEKEYEGLDLATHGGRADDHG